MRPFGGGSRPTPIDRNGSTRIFEGGGQIGVGPQGVTTLDTYTVATGKLAEVEYVHLHVRNDSATGTGGRAFAGLTLNTTTDGSTGAGRATLPKGATNADGPVDVVIPRFALRAGEAIVTSSFYETGVAGSDVWAEAYFKLSVGDA